MRKLYLPILLVPASLFCGYFYFTLLQIYFGLPAKIEFQNFIHYWWYPNLYEGSWIITPGLCILTVLTAALLAFKKSLIPIPCYIAGLTIISTFLHFTDHPEVVGFFRAGPNLSLGWVVLFYVSLSLVFAACGYVGGKVWKWDWKKIKLDEKSAKSSGEHHRYNLGFTLLEVLVVIVIIAIIAAILLPVLARSRRSALATQDRAYIHQVYIAENLYEQDYDGQSPSNLLKLIPKYADPKIFYSKLDARGSGNGSKWPVNLFLLPKTDGSDWSLFSQYPISFAYLRTFYHRFHPGDTWEKYRDDPKVGMLVDPTLDYNDPPEFMNSNYGPNEPADNFNRFLVCRMDGSITVRVVPSPCAADAYENLFLFWPYNCGSPVAGSG